MAFPDPRSLRLCSLLVAFAASVSVFERVVFFPNLHDTVEARILTVAVLLSSALVVLRWDRWGREASAVSWLALLRLGHGIAPLLDFYGDQLLRNLLLIAQPG